MRNFGICAVIVLSMVLSGCGGNLALVKGQAELNASDSSIVLVPIKIANINKPGYQPVLLSASLDGADGHRIDVDGSLFKEEKNKYKEYLMSFILKPGVYTLTDIIGNYKIMLLLNAYCLVPISAAFEVKPNSITYLGHINADIVERKDDNADRAGSLFPLMDQAIAGFSNGTFVINVEDHYDEDVARYREAYPALKSAKIDKSILPQWKSSKATLAAK